MAMEVTAAEVATLNELGRIYAIIEAKKAECRDAGNLPGFGVCMELLKTLGKDANAMRDRMRSRAREQIGG